MNAQRARFTNKETKVRTVNLIGMLLLISAAIVVSTAIAQEYPTRPIRLIVPFPPGGATDLIARLIAQKLTEDWGQQVVVDNRGGAGGNIGIGVAANATSDGYTLLVVSASYVVNPSLYRKVPYDPNKSFIPISNIAISPDVFVSHPSVPAKSLQDLVNLMRDSGKRYSIATPGIGTTSDLMAELFRLTTKADMIRVPYSGAGPAVTAVIANQVPLGSVAIPGAISHIRNGGLRALAVTSAKRSTTLPDIPTMQEAGFKGQVSEGLQGVFVPARTPKAIVVKLSDEILRIMAMPDVKKRIATFGYQTVASTPEQFAEQIKDEVEKWGKVVKSTGIKVE